MALASKKYVDRMMPSGLEHPRRLDAPMPQVFKAYFDIYQIAATSLKLYWPPDNTIAPGWFWAFGATSTVTVWSNADETAETGFSYDYGTDDVYGTYIQFGGINQNFYLQVYITFINRWEAGIRTRLTLEDEGGTGYEWHPLWYIPWNSTYNTIDKANIRDMRTHLRIGFHPSPDSAASSTPFATGDARTATVRNGLIISLD